MTRKQFLLALFAAPLAALGVKKKPDPIGLLHLRSYDALRDCYVNRFEPIYDQLNDRVYMYHPDVFAIKIGETIHVHTPARFYPGTQR